MLNIELKDNKLTDIRTDRDFTPGCPTCDYGSEYMDALYLDFESGHTFEIVSSTMYERGFSAEYFMKLLAGTEFKGRTMEYTFAQIAEKLKKSVEEKPYMYPNKGVYIALVDKDKNVLKKIKIKE